MDRTDHEVTRLQRLKAETEGRLAQLDDSPKAKAEAKRIAIGNAEAKKDSAETLLRLEREARGSGTGDKAKLPGLEATVRQAEAELVAAKADDGTKALRDLRTAVQTNLDDINQELQTAQKARREVFSSGTAGITEDQFNNFKARKAAAQDTAVGSQREASFRTKGGTTGRVMYDYEGNVSINVESYPDALQSRIGRYNGAHPKSHARQNIEVSCPITISEDGRKVRGKMEIPVNEPHPYSD